MTDTATVYRLTLPLPVLLNRLYHPRRGGGVYKHPDAEAFEWGVKLACRELELPDLLAGPVALTVYETFPREADYDAPLKLLGDALQGCLITNDAQIVEGHQYKRVQRGAGGLVVEVRAL